MPPPPTMPTTTRFNKSPMFGVSDLAKSHSFYFIIKNHNIAWQVTRGWSRIKESFESGPVRFGIPVIITRMISGRREC
jgi:hypothetical protein